MIINLISVAEDMPKMSDISDSESQTSSDSDSEAGSSSGDEPQTFRCCLKECVVEATVANTLTVTCMFMEEKHATFETTLSLKAPELNAVPIGSVGAAIEQAFIDRTVAVKVKEKKAYVDICFQMFKKNHYINLVLRPSAKIFRDLEMFALSTVVRRLVDLENKHAELKDKLLAINDIIGRRVDDVMDRLGRIDERLDKPSESKRVCAACDTVKPISEFKAYRQKDKIYRRKLCILCEKRKKIPPSFDTQSLVSLRENQTWAEEPSPPPPADPATPRKQRLVPPIVLPEKSDLT